MLCGPGQDRRHARLLAAFAFAALLLLEGTGARADVASDSTGFARSEASRPDSLAAFPAPRVRAWQVGLLRPDRLEHAGLSFTLAGAFTVAFEDRAAAAGLTLALGVGKEWWDSRHSRGEALDLVADAIGVGLAYVFIRGRAP